jgi:hypothetical protein
MVLWSADSGYYFRFFFSHYWLHAFRWILGGAAGRVLPGITGRYWPIANCCNSATDSHPTHFDVQAYFDDYSIRLNERLIASTRSASASANRAPSRGSPVLGACSSACTMKDDFSHLTRALSGVKLLPQSYPKRLFGQKKDLPFRVSL